jgi:nucleoside-triphosphatase THEP1
VVVQVIIRGQAGEGKTVIAYSILNHLRDLGFKVQIFDDDHPSDIERSISYILTKNISIGISVEVEEPPQKFKRK